MRASIEITPAKVDNILSTLAVCIGPARPVLATIEGSARFVLVNDVSDPKHEEVFFIVNLRDICLAINNKDECYVVKTEFFDRSYRDTYRYKDQRYTVSVVMPQPTINIGVVILAKEAIRRYVAGIVEPPLDNEPADSEEIDIPF